MTSYLGLGSRTMITATCLQDVVLRHEENFLESSTMKVKILAKY
jgi:hypothetical protein